MGEPPIRGGRGPVAGKDESFEVRIIGRHVRLPDEVKDYATEKVERLARYHLSKMDVVLSSEADGYRAEFIASSRRGKTFVSHAEHENYPGAIDLATEKLERQLSRTKGKAREKRVRQARNQSVPEPDRSPEEAGAEDFEYLE